MNLFSCHLPRIDKVNYSPLNHVFTCRFPLLNSLWSCKKGPKDNVKPEGFHVSFLVDSFLSMLKVFLSPLIPERSPHSNSALEVKPLHLFNRTDCQTLSTSLGEPYVPRIMYGDSFSCVTYNNPPHYSWGLRGNP